MRSGFPTDVPPYFWTIRDIVGIYAITRKQTVCLTGTIRTNPNPFLPSTRGSAALRHCAQLPDSIHANLPGLRCANEVLRFRVAATAALPAKFVLKAAQERYS